MMLKNDEKSELQIIISKIDSSKGKIELFELLEETILEYFKLLIRENNNLDSETSEEEIDLYYFMEENKFSVIDYRVSSKECLFNRSFYYDNLFKLCSLNLRHLLLNYERFPVKLKIMEFGVKKLLKIIKNFFAILMKSQIISNLGMIGFLICFHTQTFIVLI